jgi:hypothetical protein
MAGKQFVFTVAQCLSADDLLKLWQLQADNLEQQQAPTMGDALASLDTMKGVEAELAAREHVACKIMRKPVAHDHLGELFEQTRRT